MATWEEVKGNIIKAKDSVKDTAEQLTDIASLYVKIRETKKKIRGEYADLGEYVVANYEMAQTDDEKEVLHSEILSSVASVKALESELEQYKASLDEAKSKKK